MLLHLLCCNRFAARPDQWKLKQSSKQLTYKEFFATFGSGDTKSSKKDTFLANSSKQTSNSKEIKTMRKEIDNRLGSTALSGLKRRWEKAEQLSEKYAKHISRGKNMKKKNNQVSFENTGAPTNEAENASKPFLTTDRAVKKQHRKDKPSKVFKKLKTWRFPTL